MLTASLLNANSAVTQSSVQQYVAGDFNEFTVKFAGSLNYLLSRESLSNKEWIVANPDRPAAANGTRYFWTLSKNSYSSPNNIEPRDLETKYSPDYNQKITVTSNSVLGHNLQVRLKVWNRDGQVYATFMMQGDPGTLYRIGDSITIPAVSSVSFPEQTILLEVHEVAVGNERVLGYSSELNPFDAAADFWKFQQDKSSHLDGPEHSIVMLMRL